MKLVERLDRVSQQAWTWVDALVDRSQCLVTDQSGWWAGLLDRLPAIRLGIRQRMPGRAALGPLAIAIGVLTLLLWNWPLALALAAGVGTMALVYLAQDWGWQHWDWQDWARSLQPWFAGANRLVLLAVALGAVAMVGTYVMTTLWLEAGAWVAIAIGLQGVLLLLLVLGLGIGRTESMDRLDQTLLDLTHSDALNRLLAVRQLGRCWPRLDERQRQDIHQALQLLLAQEPEPIVREGILNVLEPLLLNPLAHPGRLQRSLKTLTAAPASPSAPSDSSAPLSNPTPGP